MSETSIIYTSNIFKWIAKCYFLRTLIIMLQIKAILEVKIYSRRMHWWDKGQIDNREYCYCVRGINIWRDYFNQNRTGLVVDALHLQSIVSTAIFFLFTCCSNELTKIVGRLWLDILSLSNVRIFNPPCHFFDHTGTNKTSHMGGVHTFIGTLLVSSGS